MKKFTFLLFSTILLILCCQVNSFGQLSITATGTAFTQNFDGIGITATAALPSGWTVSGGTVFSAGTLATTVAYGTSGTGIVTSSSGGGTVNWANGVTATSTDRSVGFLTSGSFASPRNLFVQIVNNTGGTLNSITISFDIEKYRSGSRAWNVNFYSGTDGSTWAPQTGGDQAYPADANNTTVYNPPTSQSKSVTITGLSIANGANYYFRWAYTGTSGSTNSQGLGFDNISITASGGATAPAVTASNAGSITPTSALFNGNISSDGGSALSDRGFYYKTSAGVTTSDIQTSAGGTATGDFSKSMTLSSGTNYFYKAYATNGVGTTLSSNEISFWTFSTEPTAHSTTLTNSVISQTQIDLGFDALSSITNATGYLILKKAGSAPTGLPADGTAYTVGTAIGDGTVAAIVTSASATSSSITGLTGGTAYYFEIIPFGNGSNNATYNYKTDGIIPVTNGTTLAPLASTSEISGPALGSQPNPVLLSSLTTTDAAAVRVLDMDVYDYGSDAQPTKITQVTIKAGTGNTANWANSIQGVKLSKDAGSTFVTIGTPTITAASIVIPITTGNLNIPDNNALTLSLYVYLKSSGLTDNQVFEFKVDATASSHGFVADGTGSTFLATFTAAPVSNQILIDVVATKLNFVQQPTNVVTAANITPAVTVSATDANGNKDLNYTTSVSVAATGLTGTPVSAIPVSGLATFSTLSFAAPATSVSLAATSGSLTSATSNAFNVLLVPVAGEIVINQFNPGYNGASNEYIELLNKTNKTFDLSQLKIVYSSAGGSGPSSLGTLSGTLLPYSFWLLSPDATITVGSTSVLARDGSLTAGMAAASGQIGLQTLGNVKIDGVAYGTITVNTVGEGSPAPPPAVAKDGIKRAVEGVDNNTNSIDFVSVSNASIYLRNHNSICVSAAYTLPATSYPADVVISGSTPAVTLSGNTTITGKLTILSGSLTVSSSQNLTVTGTLTNSAGNTGLILQSDVTGTGSLIENSGVPATVQRYITKYNAPGDDMFHFLSSPVIAQSISPQFSDPANNSTDDFYKFDETTYMWINHRDNAGTGINASFGETDFAIGRGYLVAYNADVTKSFGGTLNTGNISIPALSRTTFSNPDKSGWNLVGNPYPSAIDWNNVASSQYTDIDAAIYVYDNASSTYKSTVPNSGTTPPIGNLPGGIIPAMQGFFVHANGSSPSLILENQDRVHSSQAYYKSEIASNILRLRVEGNSKYDETFIRFTDEATMDFDSQLDAYKLYGGAGVPQLFSSAGTTKLSINSLPNSSLEGFVPISVVAGVSSTYVITLAENTLPSNYYVTLEDLKTGVSQRLNTQPSYSFAAAPGDDPNRFRLYFKDATSVPNPISVDFTVYSNNGSIFVTSTESGNPVIRISDLTGRVLASGDLLNGKFQANMNGNTGVYLVSQISSKGIASHKVVVK
ncbi:MAG: T9SS type A sorting domain-containing protein [Bacteroidetes bacterium]|nr:T9SS type A sorting domain-containing protein [Bacteroidota bacterium]